VIFIPNEQWFNSLPPATSQVPCGGTGEHTVRWHAGAFQLPSHQDPEAELVLAALGGDKAECVRLAAVWAAHAEDLEVLLIGPRGPADQVVVGWDDVQAAVHAGWTTYRGPVAASGHAATRFPMRPGHGPPRVRQAMAADLEQARRHTADQLSLLALGSAFQFRLAGHVAAAHATRLTAANRPALTAALEGRLAPVAETWLGIDPDQVRASLPDGAGDGWGAVTLTGSEDDRLLRFALPAGWLASVWACGLALVARHLVVTVVRPGWPDAQVLALPAPGRDPVQLDVHGAATASGDVVRWET
jgi:hypothetical protein